MTLRDYFAVHASAEDLRPHMESIRDSQRKQYGAAAILPDNWPSIARYMHADAMLEARNHAMEEAAHAFEQHNRENRQWVSGSLWGNLTTEGCARIRALKEGGAT